MNTIFHKNISDSNKENMTPSSRFSSSSKMLSMFNENNLKSLREKKENVIESMEVSQDDYFRLLKEKEQLEFIVAEKEAAITKEKGELEYLNNMLRLKEEQKSKISEKTEEANRWLENEFISKNMFETVDNLPGNKIIVKLKNDVCLVGVKDKDSVNCQGVYKINQGNLQSNINEIYEREFANDANSLMYFAAFNIN